MKYLKQFATFLLAAAVNGAALGADVATPSSADIDKAISAISDYDLGESRLPLSEAERIINTAAGHPQLAQRIEDQLIQLLQSKGSHECKLFACELLRRIGTDRSVATLKSLLADESSAYMACLALGSVPGEASLKALRESLADAKGKARLCIIGTLSQRHDQGSVQVLGRLASSADQTIAEAAIAALGRISGPDAAAILARLRAAADPKMQDAVTSAYLQCAAELTSQGKRDQAVSIYREILAKPEPTPYRRGALAALIDLGGPEGVSLVLSTIAGNDRLMQATAIAHIRSLQGQDVTQRFAAELPRLPAHLQILLIEALEDRGDAAARPAITVAAGSNNSSVRSAAIKVLGSIGDSSCIALLASAIAEGKTDEERHAAAASLRRIQGEGIDAALISSMKQAMGDARAQMIDVLSDRHISAAVPALISEAQKGDVSVRRSALRALAHLASADAQPALLDILVGLEGDAIRQDAESAVIAAARQSGNDLSRADAIIASLGSVKTPAARCSLIRILRSMGNARAFEAVRASLTDADPMVQETAVRALTDWPDVRALPVVLEICRNTQNQTHRVVAMRGCIRLLGMSDATQDTLRAYRTLMDLARRPEEQRLVLAGLAKVAHPGALAMTEACIAGAEVSAEAAMATLSIARAIGSLYPAHAAAAMDKLAAATKEESIHRQAQEIAAQIPKPTVLFDGKTFDGWEGPLGVFRIADGAIVGGSLNSPVARNEFLTTRKEFRDFELRLQFKLLGKDPNAGIQIRSRRIPNNHEMIGYQADMGQVYWGCLYDESRRNRVLAAANNQELMKVLRPEDWNEYTIHCRGKRIQLWINGYQTVDYTESDDTIEQVGLIGLQIHGGPPSEVWYRNITIRELPPMKQQ